MRTNPNPNCIAQEDRDAFVKVLQNEKPEIIWSLFREFGWHDRQNEPEIQEMVKHMIIWAKAREAGIPCCS